LRLPLKMSRGMPTMSGLAQGVEKMVGGLGDRVIELSRDKWSPPRALLPLP